MPSNSLQHWQDTRIRELDEIENAHRGVGGRGPGRRYATQQINHAYAMLLSSQFQGFCRDLHSEAVEHILSCVAPSQMHRVLRKQFTIHRMLDRGNPNPGNIGADFNRLDMSFLDLVRTRNRLNDGRIDRLVELNRWRNAIAHQDFASAELSGTMRLEMVRQWRQACEQLAIEFDAVIGTHLTIITGIAPW